MSFTLKCDRYLYGYLLDRLFAKAARNLLSVPSMAASTTISVQTINVSTKPPNYHKYDYFAPPKMRIGSFNRVKGSTLFPRFIAAVVLCLVLLSGCRSKGVPPGVLTKPEMVKVLSEIYISEEKVSRLGLSRDSAEAVAFVFETKVFEKAATSDSIFRKSFDYYMDRPADMELIYTAVVDSLQLQEQKVPFHQP
jgi:hypothetical protein